MTDNRRSSASPHDALAEALNKRLRAEAAEWAEDEPVRTLMLEAAEAIELLAADVAISRHALAALRAGSGDSEQTNVAPEWMQTRARRAASNLPARTQAEQFGHIDWITAEDERDFRDRAGSGDSEPDE